MIRYEEVKPSRFNDELKDMYSWSNVAERTEKVGMLKKEITAQHDSLWESSIFLPSTYINNNNIQKKL